MSAACAAPAWEMHLLCEGYHSAHRLLQYSGMFCGLHCCLQTSYDISWRESSKRSSVLEKLVLLSHSRLSTKQKGVPYVMIDEKYVGKIPTYKATHTFRWQSGDMGNGRYRQR